ncbi:DUF4446 family protein [Kytococcus sedentarius]|uniref:Uncharacterized protein n=1 Tax=Kytococcus sedentarius (strain ATCC 14392 / DSM 20547 / JCM 11482 / CCUG 33030 / NBRC 15357 / NCTC 11040 / CCM 314 / 541) TaxID=478801 RepID=C7NJ30_KYTSD|nr:DUF4446 family protein [Kytococcus sedentarius]ACV05255.1 hypothetical protein Ksed_01670 [Kytococcus sedentarius DSM 20547]
MSEPVQNALLITAVVCAVLALLIGLWLAFHVTSLRRQRFISARVLAGAGAGDGQGPQRRSMASRQGEQRRYTAPAVRTGVDSVTMKRALDRAASRQEKSLAKMRQEIDRTRAQVREELERTSRQVKEVSQGFDRVQQQASSDTQAIRQVSTDATQNLQRMTTDVASLDERLVALQQQVAAAEERLQSAGLEELGAAQRQLDEWRQTVSQELDEATSHRATLAEQAASDRTLLDTIDRGLGGVAGVVDELRRDTSTMQERATSLDERLVALQQQVAAAEERLQSTGAGLEELGAAQRQLDEWRQTVSQELDEATSHRATLAEQAASDRTLLDTIDRGLGGVAGVVDELRRDTSTMQERATSLDERLATLVGTTDTQAQRVEQLETGATQLGERTAGLDSALRALSESGDDLDRRLKKLEHTSESALTEVALVRYDAFGDMGGRMSFSVAMLDGVGDGLIITSLNGRSHSQTYAKSVTEGRGTTRLTAEEEQAVAAARGVETTNAPEQAVRPLRQRR